MTPTSCRAYTQLRLGHHGDTADFTTGNGGAMALANIIGGNEGLYTGSTYFVGESGASNDRQCTAKTITNLGQVRGQCPNDSGTEGSFYLPAVAYYANKTDLRSGSVGSPTSTARRTWSHTPWRSQQRPASDKPAYQHRDDRALVL